MIQPNQEKNWEKRESQELNTCNFCRAERPVMRQYLYAKNKPIVGDGFDFIYYCADCGLKEMVIGKNDPTIIYQNRREDIKEEIKKEQKRIENLITEEILIAQKENQPTSRLTSLIMKIKGRE